MSTGPLQCVLFFEVVFYPDEEPGGGQPFEPQQMNICFMECVGESARVHLTYQESRQLWTHWVRAAP